MTMTTRSRSAQRANTGTEQADDNADGGYATAPESSAATTQGEATTGEDTVATGVGEAATTTASNANTGDTPMFSFNQLQTALKKATEMAAAHRHRWYFKGWHN